VEDNAVRKGYVELPNGAANIMIICEVEPFLKEFLKKTSRFCKIMRKRLQNRHNTVIFVPPNFIRYKITLKNQVTCESRLPSFFNLIEMN